MSSEDQFTTWLEDSVEHVLQDEANRRGIVRPPGGENAQVCDAIETECNAIASLLIEKNVAYGNSALEPTTYRGREISADDGLSIRICDKIKRLQSGREVGSDDSELDLIGYLILRRVLRRVG